MAAPPAGPALDAHVAEAMAATHSRGMAIAVIDHGKVVYVKAYGDANNAGAKLKADTILYGASLTKAVFADMVMQLVGEGRLGLDTPISAYLKKPLPDYASEKDERYAPWKDLAGDDRWKKLTPRILLTHSSGLANFYFLEPDQKLRFHFEPGTRYAYSGQGLLLLQFVLEEGLGLDVGAEIQRRVFDRYGMPNSSMKWRDDFKSHMADGWQIDGSVVGHRPNSKVRVAGSMDTTIEDMARFAAGLVRGDGLTAKAWSEMTSPQLPITTPAQFPTFQLPELPPEKRYKSLSAGLGVVTFKGPQGAGFMKGGHIEWTGNTMVCLKAGKRCVVILSNDVRSEGAFPELVRFVLGDTDFPWKWEYSDIDFWTPAGR